MGATSGEDPRARGARAAPTKAAARAVKLLVIAAAALLLLPLLILAVAYLLLRVSRQATCLYTHEAGKQRKLEFVVRELASTLEPRFALPPDAAIPVWVMSLRGAAARRANMSAQLSAQRIEFEFIDSVDGAVGGARGPLGDRAIWVCIEVPVTGCAAQCMSGWSGWPSFSSMGVARIKWDPPWWPICGEPVSPPFRRICDRLADGFLHFTATPLGCIAKQLLKHASTNHCAVVSLLSTDLSSG